MLKRTAGNYIPAGVLQQETHSKGHSRGPELRILFLTGCAQVLSQDRIPARCSTRFLYCLGLWERESLLRLDNFTDQKGIVSPGIIVRLSLNKYVLFLVRLLIKIFFTSNPESMSSLLMHILSNTTATQWKYLKDANVIIII